LSSILGKRKKTRGNNTTDTAKPNEKPNDPIDKTNEKPVEKLTEPVDKTNEKPVEKANEKPEKEKHLKASEDNLPKGKK